MMKKLKLCALVFFSATPLCTQAGLKEVMHDLLAGVTGNRERIGNGTAAVVSFTIALTSGIYGITHARPWESVGCAAVSIFSIYYTVKFGARAYYNVAEHPSLC
jgi:hypothetical protein